jgi:hypothetical protein
MIPPLRRFQELDPGRSAEAHSSDEELEQRDSKGQT